MSERITWEWQEDEGGIEGGKYAGLVPADRPRRAAWDIPDARPEGALNAE